MTPPEVIKIVKVIWADSQIYGEHWISRENAASWACDLKGPVVHSVGIVLHECPEYIVLVQSLSNDAANAVIKIPRRAATSIERLTAITYDVSSSAVFTPDESDLKRLEGEAS